MRQLRGHFWGYPSNSGFAPFQSTDLLLAAAGFRGAAMASVLPMEVCDRPVPGMPGGSEKTRSGNSDLSATEATVVAGNRIYDRGTSIRLGILKVLKARRADQQGRRLGSVQTPVCDEHPDRPVL